MFYGIGEVPIPFRVSSRAIYHIIFSIIPDIKDFFIISIPTSFISYFLSPRLAGRAAFYMILYRFALLKKCIFWL